MLDFLGNGSGLGWCKPESLHQECLESSGASRLDNPADRDDPGADDGDNPDADEDNPGDGDECDDACDTCGHFQSAVQ